MKRETTAFAVVFGDYNSYETLSYSDTREIISNAEERRSRAILESIEDYPHTLRINTCKIEVSFLDPKL